LRAFALFLVLVIIALVVGASIAYPAFQLASTVGHWAFHRVGSRIAMLVLAAELFWYAKHVGLRTRSDFGYGLPWRRFVTQSLWWGLIGMLTAVPAAAFLLGAHIRSFHPGVVFTAGYIVKLFGIGLSSGIAVALIEETVMRGALHTAVQRESGPWAAALLIAPLFAILHFFAKVRIPPNELGWRSGFDLLIRSFAPLGHPLNVLDSFLSWVIVGLILSLTRVRTGNIAMAIGLHAGWVIVLRMMQESTVRTPGGRFDFWVGSFDGLIGYWMIPWGIALGAALWLTRSRWESSARSPA
jgi:uncharacterized protein